MLNDPPHALLNTPTATAPLPLWDEVSIWTSKAWDVVSYKRLYLTCLVTRPLSPCRGGTSGGRRATRTERSFRSSVSRNAS